MPMHGEQDAGGNAHADRKAALLLHSLPEPAKQQALSRLSAERRDRMSSLLAELNALGIPAGRQWHAVRQDMGSQQSAREQVHALAPVVVAELLSKQSLSTVRALLSITKWQWHTEVTGLMPASLRKAFEPTTADAVRIGPKAANALISALLASVQSNPSGGMSTRPVARSNKPFWQRLLPSSK